MSGLVWSPGPRAVACGFPAERGGQRRGCWSPGSPGTLTRRGHGSRGVNLLPGEWPSPASGPAVPGLDPQRPRHLLLELKSLQVSGGGGGTSSVLHAVALGNLPQGFLGLSPCQSHARGGAGSVSPPEPEPGGAEAGKERAPGRRGQLPKATVGC